ncbi:NAD(P)-binding protein [Saitoella complicata NRRL Y-17804]|uniref:NAD(P)-binding protein n=1 Tax=Saitoella complicata (strain BCRC 22490 / CBS 7301 / JCM 7358 / NBRC 10748 / NRRL Y-17804) TaxID=698492 RepID=UPI0008670256|nr:NAD(P)-binding protein [Saitoella complicata NRRL Y-17804]ODQ56144.1 NAD(P)-binding protein [Saitoella complicata NRRL Y-17804]
MSTISKKDPSARDSTSHPASYNPQTPTTQSRNTYSPFTTFPFRTWHAIPGLPQLIVNLRSWAGYAVQSDSVGCFQDSGIGAALVQEYANEHTHLILLARSKDRLSEVSSTAHKLGATVNTHSLEFLEHDQIVALKELLVKVDREYGGIDIAISVTGITGHREDVVGRRGPTKSADESEPLLRESYAHITQGSEWGATTAERMIRVNVEACSAFILTCYDLMKLRQAKHLPHNKKRTTRKIVIVASSAAYFAPANFALYAASKAFLYSLGVSLVSIAAPFDIQVTTVTPGFIESGMTQTMLATGMTTPHPTLGHPQKMARAIRRGEERGDVMVAWPVIEVAGLFGARALSPLVEVLGRWIGMATGSAGWVLS